jgi:hypothetical protein
MNPLASFLAAGPVVPQDLVDAYVGQNGMVEENGLKFSVKVLDVRRRYGHTDLLITPRDGTGTTWIDSERFIRSNIL